MIDLAQRAGGWAGGRPSGRAVRTEHGHFASVWGGGGLPSCRLRRSSDLTAATESCSLTTTAEVRPCGDVSRISIAPCPCSAARARALHQALSPSVSVHSACPSLPSGAALACCSLAVSTRPLDVQLL